MGLELYSKFINFNSPIASQEIGMTNGLSMPELYYEPDFFDTQTGKSATNAGVILAVGMTIRGFLKKLSDGFFAKYFSKKQNIDEQELKKISFNMLKDKKLMSKSEACSDILIDGVRQPQISEAWLNKEGSKFKLNSVIINKSGQDAYFNHVYNFIKVTKDTIISLPHEIGHAVQEHSTSILKKLQRSRGRYSALALVLYGLGREIPKNAQEKQSIFEKLQNILHKYNIFIPLIVFLPELITEFAASKIGIDYIKKHIKNLKTNEFLNAKAIENSKNILKATKKYYAVAYCTYLSLPLFAVLDNYIFKKASKN